LCKHLIYFLLLREILKCLFSFYSLHWIDFLVEMTQFLSNISRRWAENMRSNDIFKERAILSVNEIQPWVYFVFLIRTKTTVCFANSRTNIIFHNFSQYVVYLLKINIIYLLYA
jgi:hypothetical protein